MIGPVVSRIAGTIRLGLFGLVLAVLVVTLGADETMASLLASVLVFAVCLLLRPRLFSRLDYALALALVLGFGFMAADCVTTSLGDWKTLVRALGPEDRLRLLVLNDRTLALVTIAAPLFLFGTIFLGRLGDRRVLLALRGLCILALATGIVAIVQFLFFEDNLLFATKKYYMGSLTFPFVYKNTACSYYALYALVSLFLARITYRDRVRSGGIRLFRDEWALHLTEFLVLASCAGLANSMAGLFAFGLALAAMGYLFVVQALLRRRSVFGMRLDRRRFGLVLLAFCLASLLAVLAGLHMAEVAVETQNDGLDPRLCNLKDVWRATVDGLPFGHGPGMFARIFPLYRDAACGVLGTFDRAHNVFLEGLFAFGWGFAAMLLAYGLLIGLLIVKALRRLSVLRDVSVLLVGINGLVVTHSLFDFSLQMPGFSLHFALVLALAASLARNSALGEAQSVPRSRSWAAPPPGNPAEAVVERF